MAAEIAFMRRQTYWRYPDSTSRPGQVINALKVATQLGTYPCIATLLGIFVTLPVTSAATNRSFSALKYPNKYMRSTMNEQRINGLAHMNVNRDIKLNHDDEPVISFSKLITTSHLSCDKLFTGM